MAKKLTVGTVARCKAGKVGLITNVGRRRISPGEWSKLYTGVCLSGRRAGFSWQSIDPTPISNLDDWVVLRHEEISHG